MNADYLKQNALGFEGDTFAKQKFQQLCEQFKIHTIYETGTYMGGTTKQLATMAKQVHSIEINEANCNKAKLNLQAVDNVNLHFGSSETILDNLLSAINPKAPTKNNIFCFLDAHWNEYNPLLDELAVIAKHKLKPVIAIHDFKVPNNSTLGFDTYGKIVYEWSWIASSIDAIYGKDKYVIEYNSEATGAKRGIIYIYPKKK